MRYKLILSISICIIMIFSGGLMAAVDNDVAVVHKVITTHRGNWDNPYSIFYPIQLEKPGLISVRFRPVNPEMPIRYRPGSPMAFKIHIVSPDIFVDMSENKWINWLENIEDTYPEMRRIRSHIFSKYVYESVEIKDTVRTINYPVDSVEFNKSNGKYVIYLKSMVPETVESIFIINYPGSRNDFDPEVDKYRSVHPDLVVENITLDKNNKLQVHIKNIGQASVNWGYWNLKGEKAVTLIAEIDGRKYGVTLPVFDPEQKLREQNNTVIYTFDKIEINNKTKVKVTVDKSDILIEKNENNNEKIIEIAANSFEVEDPKISLNIGLQNSGLKSEPDLIVKSINLSEQNKIIIELENIGSSIDKNLWNENNVILKLKKDGSIWSNVYKSGFDPENKLINSGAKVIFNTGLELNQEALIEASIDESDIIEEANENNNIMDMFMQIP